MTSPVFYRKWRPRRLSQVVGQEPVTRTLRQALAQNRVAHAYLFCGPRGTGKTSTARILAKGINCLNPQEGEPCDSCPQCQAIHESRALDLVEIDAASHRGIDDVREIREKVGFAPLEGAFKVYVIDEAHMLTEPAFNALLKTLEEPPAHVIFVLCTTDPHKVPATITSRCQRFDFRRITTQDTVQRLMELCQAEDIQADPEALETLARSAGGSLRDAENLLEQCATSLGSAITLEGIRSLLGLAADHRVRILAGHILQTEVAEALALLNTLASEGLDLHQLHRQMVGEMRDLLLVKAGAGGMVEQPVEVIAEQVSLAESVEWDALLHGVRTLGQVSFRNEAPSLLPLELAVVECTLGAHPEAPPQRSASTEAPAPRASAPRAPTTPQRSTPPSPQPTAAPSSEGPPAPERSPAPERRPEQPAPAAAGAPNPSHDQWDQLVKTLSRHKGRRFNLGALLRSCRGHRWEGDTLVLDFTHRSHKERMEEELEDPASRRTFLEAMERCLEVSQPVNLSLTVANGTTPEAASTPSPLVQAALSMGARILPDEEEEQHE